MSEKMTVEEFRKALAGGRGNFEGVTIQGDLNLSTLTVESGLDLSEATVGGNLNLGETTVKGGLNLFGATVEGNLNLFGATVKGGLNLFGATVKGKIRCDNFAMALQCFLYFGKRVHCDHRDIAKAIGNLLPVPSQQKESCIPMTR